MFERHRPHDLRIALVTGGARGIGRATASALLADGFRVAIADVDEVTATKAARELGSSDVVRAYGLDVTDLGAFTEVVARIEDDLGPVDVVVNNAGIMPLGAFLDQDPSTDRLQIDINIHGVLHGMRACLPGMLARNRGHVVNIASGVGRIPTPHAAVYSATKHAVIGLTEATRAELRDSEVRFSYVCPGLVETELISGAGRVRYPPPTTPEVVASRIVEALHTGQVAVYVPRFIRLTYMLSAVLPRSVAERVAKAFRLDSMFAHLDDDARAAYRDRIHGRRRSTAENQ